eukprot:12677231-Alexandrium_andersonii.AAC.1
MQKSLEVLEPGTARLQKRPQIWSPRLWTGGSAPFLAQVPNVPTKEAGGRAGGASRRFSGASRRAELPG